MITAEYLRDRLDYDPSSGRLIWRAKPETSALAAYWNRRHAGMNAGSFHGNGRRRITIDNVSYDEHRIVWLHVTGEWPQKEIDHIDRNPENNRFANLRLATRAQNARNKKICRVNSSGVTGVTRHRSANKWQAQIEVNGKNHYLGLFDDIEAAKAARFSAESTLFGEWAGERP